LTSLLDELTFYMREREGAVLAVQKGAVLSKRGLFVFFALAGTLFALLGLTKSSRRFRRPSYLV
jgi:hypothetical protein